MRIISISTLVAYWEKHPDAEQPLKAWIAEVKKANWQNAHEIKAQYKSASILKNRRKFIGTHTEYDRINANDVELN